MEFPFKGVRLNGFLMLFVELVMFALCALLVFTGQLFWVILGILLGVTAVICLGGFLMLQPNQTCVTIWFGKYTGTITEVGYSWINPFYTTRHVSRRINNLDVAPIKVNDLIGNPVMIGLVLVWRINDTYRVTFDLDAGQTVTSFVAVQSDAALREVASHYPYDDAPGHDGLTLRSGGEEINHELREKLNERLSIGGIEVVEARINYLAYAPEIAAVMLRRQQASAIIAAREKIVEGAVSMVEVALDKLAEGKRLDMSDTEKARMAANLMVVLCADESATPVLNAGN